MAGKLYIVIPCYKEEQALPYTMEVLIPLLEDMVAEGIVDKDSRITLVDDGSPDGTWQVISGYAGRFGVVEGLKLAHNVGHQNALWAGMMTVRPHADFIVSIDADLQDDPYAIPEFVRAHMEGAEIVYGVRANRDVDTGFKRNTAQMYYTVLRKIGVDVVYNHADYRLIGRRALDALAEYGEVNLFLRGMVPTLGFQTATVEYTRSERVAGESKYPLRKMLALAMEGVTSFTIAPIRWIVLFGVLFVVLGIAIALYVLFSLFTRNVVPGWASMMVSVWLIGGAQLIALGLIGEYIGKIYMETKRRPRYIVEEYKKKG